MQFFQDLKTHFTQELPFVAYRKPNEEEVCVLKQHHKELITTTEYSEAGFVFAPFDSKSASVLMPLYDATFTKVLFTKTQDFKNTFEGSLGLSNVSELKHLALVQKAIDAIESDDFKKVVLSCREIIELPDLDFITLFERLLLKYTTAFVYVWYHPKVGMWLGATPETLVRVTGNDFETMSLAGTRAYKDTLQVNWQQKELTEQQIVTDYIEQELAQICNSITIHERSTVKAGNLVHLQTKISGKTSLVKNLILGLHPTPAVCGLPKNQSKEFILTNEGYSREYYTGFLGELNFNMDDTSTTSLYVNLRCMQVKKDKVLVYVGGGVTKDSIPVKEWEELEMKSKVMKSVLQ